MANCTAPVAKKAELIKAVSKIKKDTLQQLYSYWNLEDVEHPLTGDVSYKDNYGEYVPGISFVANSEIVENPKGEIKYGRFVLKNKKLSVKYDNGQTGSFEIMRLDTGKLILKRLIRNEVSVLTYSPTSTFWPEATTHPFSKKNFKWTQKPSRPENQTQIKERLKDCILFYNYYFRGFINDDAKKIDFNYLPSCFNWYAGGISVQSEKKLDPKWINCFYSTSQAYYARNMVDEAITKNYIWDTTQTNWLKQTAPVLMQMHDSL
ncbi:MAG: hypothetical protein ABI784_10290 [Ginsengibacter sp.]